MTPRRSEFDALVAGSMDAEPELRNHLPELLQDLEDLGARARDVVAILRGKGLGRGARVLDLGCGKGAAALALAREYGATLRGIDGMPEFIRHARAQAEALGLAEQCTFEVGDVRTVPREPRGYDLVALLAVGPVFGDLADTIGALRQHTTPGGLVLVDDAYLAAGADVGDEVVDCHDHGTTLRLLQSHGDRVIAERTMDTEDNQLWCREMTAAIRARAESLAARRPDLAKLALGFAERQRRETELLCGPVVGALWLLRIAG